MNQKHVEVEETPCKSNDYCGVCVRDRGSTVHFSPSKTSGYEAGHWGEAFAHLQHHGGPNVY